MFNLSRLQLHILERAILPSLSFQDKENRYDAVIDTHVERFSWVFA